LGKKDYSINHEKAGPNGVGGAVGGGKRQKRGGKGKRPTRRGKGGELERLTPPPGGGNIEAVTEGYNEFRDQKFVWGWGEKRDKGGLRERGGGHGRGNHFDF